MMSWRLEGDMGIFRWGNSDVRHPLPLRYQDSEGFEQPRAEWERDHRILPIQLPTLNRDGGIVEILKIEPEDKGV